MVPLRSLSGTVASEVGAYAERRTEGREGGFEFSTVVSRDLDNAAISCATL